MSTPGRPRRAFITGATGFIGGHLARQLLARGYQVSCLVRNPASAAAQALQAAGAELVPGDVTDADSLRGPLAGADVLFHLAGWYFIGRADTTPALPVNVGGTRTVLELARELELPNVVYTSTVAVLGNTRGRVVDETHWRRAPFVSAYSRSKTMACEIAGEMAAQGLPIRIVLPGVAYGPGDHSVVALFLQAFLHGWLPVIAGADAGLALAHVADIAMGHILAAERGRAGERYLLGGENLTYGEMLRQVAALSDRPAPVMLRSWPLPALIAASKLAGRFFSLPPILHPETLAHLNRVTYWCSSRKAEEELGWRPRPFAAGAAETVQWEMAQMKPEAAR